MTRKIRIIEEVFDVPLEARWDENTTRTKMFDGYVIETEDETIQILVQNEQQCCENCGYIVSEDELSQFVGANILEVSVVDESLITTVLNKLPVVEDDYTYLEAVFVNVNTDKGLLQFAVYNAQNGYYGHEIRILSKELNYTNVI